MPTAPPRLRIMLNRPEAEPAFSASMPDVATAESGANTKGAGLDGFWIHRVLQPWCSRLARRPNVSLVWQATQIAELARTLDRKCEDCRCPDRTANTRSRCRARRTKHDDVLAQLKAKPLRGGPKGPALT